jgi:hypothetical protein
LTALTILSFRINKKIRLLKSGAAFDKKIQARGSKKRKEKTMNK